MSNNDPDRNVLVTRRADRTVPIAISQAAYVKIAAAAVRLGVPVGEVIDKMIARIELAEDAFL